MHCHDYHSSGGAFLKEQCQTDPNPPWGDIGAEKLLYKLSNVKKVTQNLATIGNALYQESCEMSFYFTSQKRVFSLEVKYLVPGEL